jgi:ADP-heptose:LPS heptosyltransferase
VVIRDLADHRARIALLRGTPGLGDLLCAVPSWRALRRALPDATVTLIAQPRFAALVRRFGGYIDDLLAFPGFPGIPDAGQNVRSTVRFLAEAQERRFDLVIQQHGSGVVSNPIAALLGGRRTGGFFVPGQWQPDPETFVAYPTEAHEVHRHLALMAHLGAPPAGDALELPVFDADRHALPARPEPPYAVLHPGASDRRRRWRPSSFAAVGDALGDAGLAVVVTGGDDERPLTRVVCAEMHRPALDLAGATRLGPLAALVDGAHVVVCNDTGISHVAAAVATPSVVVVVGPTSRGWLPLERQRHVAVDGTGPDAVADVVSSALGLIRPCAATA